MTHIDLAFTLTAARAIPADHGYALYGAISRILPEVHRDNGIAVHPIRGRQLDEGHLLLMPWSTLTLRVPDGQIAPALPLAGKSLPLGDTTLRVGVPQVHALIPATSLRSRLVIIKAAHAVPAHNIPPDRFTAAVRKQLQTLGIADQAQIILPPNKTGQPRRRALSIKHRRIVGYEVIIEGLTAAESITLQEHGLGGRRHMGCGVFVAHEAAMHRRQS